MRLAAFLFSLCAGAACGYLLGHILGPAPGTRFDASYRSRLDRALAEGKAAAAARAQELQAEFARRQAGRTAPD